LFPSLGDLNGDDASVADVGTNDVTLPSDASSDSPTAPDVDAGPWCATHTPLGGVCFDYDEPDSATVNPDDQCSDTPTCHANNTIGPDDDSPPNALLLTIPVLNPYPAYAQVRDKYPWPNSFQTATLAFDMKINSTNATGILGALEWGAFTYQFNLNGDSFILKEVNYIDGGPPDEDYPVNGPIDFSQWHRYSLTVSASKKTVTMTIDGVSVIDDTTHDVPLSGAMQFDWGVNYVNGPIPETLYQFDNVVLSTSNP
jgi:hypothetical protein